MKTSEFDPYAPLETALKETGFKVEQIEKQDKKTVITISPRDKTTNLRFPRQYSPIDKK